MSVQVKLADQRAVDSLNNRSIQLAQTLGLPALGADWPACLAAVKTVLTNLDVERDRSSRSAAMVDELHGRVRKMASEDSADAPDLYALYMRQRFLLPSTVGEALGVVEPPRRLVIDIPKPCDRPLPSQPSAPRHELVLLYEQVWLPSLHAVVHVYLDAEVSRLGATPSDAKAFTAGLSRAWLRAQRARADVSKRCPSPGALDE